MAWKLIYLVLLVVTVSSLSTEVIETPPVENFLSENDTSIESWFRNDYVLYEEAEAMILFREIPQDWRTARLECAAQGARLASPLLKLANTMKSILTSSPVGDKVFTGIRWSHVTNEFHSVEGVRLHKIPRSWNKDSIQPKHKSVKEECIVFDHKGELETVDCNLKYPYFCYKALEKIEEEDRCGEDSGFILYSSGSCYKDYKEPASHAEAPKICAKEGAALARITKEDLHKPDIRDLFQTTTNYTCHVFVSQIYKSSGDLEFNCIIPSQVYPTDCTFLGAHPFLCEKQPKPRFNSSP